MIYDSKALNINLSIYDFLQPISSWYQGIPFYHMWYMYMIVGLYFFTPFIIKLINKTSTNFIYFLTFFFLIVDMLISHFITLIWPLKFIEYIGYFLLGYCIRKYTLENSKKPYIFYISWLLSALIVFLATQYLVFFSNESIKLYFYGYNTPVVILGSCSLFLAVGLTKDIKSNFNFKLIANHCFNIYLIYALILDLFLRYKTSHNIEIPNSILYVPIISLAIFLITFILSLLLKNIKKFINQ